MSYEGINVLSLFDGISCGRIALERSNIKVKNYFASEIDKHAIKVSKKNYPDIIHIGDVNNIFDNNLPNIDLLIGGSPCQGFSFAGKQLNFDDPRSKLFFKYVDVLKYYKPKYFLLENVKMKKENQDIISESLGVDPILINSNLVSAQNRKRLYWTNIQNISQPEDKGILFKDLIDKDGPYTLWSDSQMKKFLNKEYIRNDCYLIEDKDKVRCLMASSGVNKPKVWYNKEYLRYLTPKEYERLQTIPDNYTDEISNNQRYKVIGNAWTVDVISHILNYMEVEEI